MEQPLSNPRKVTAVFGLSLIAINLLLLIGSQTFTIYGSLTDIKPRHPYLHQDIFFVTHTLYFAVLFLLIPNNWSIASALLAIAFLSVDIAQPGRTSRFSLNFLLPFQYVLLFPIVRSLRFNSDYANRIRNIFAGYGLLASAFATFFTVILVTKRDFSDWEIVVFFLARDICVLTTGCILLMFSSLMGRFIFNPVEYPPSDST